MGVTFMDLQSQGPYLSFSDLLKILVSRYIICLWTAFKTLRDRLFRPVHLFGYSFSRYFDISWLFYFSKFKLIPLFASKYVMHIWKVSNIFQCINRIEGSLILKLFRWYPVSVLHWYIACLDTSAFRSTQLRVSKPEKQYQSQGKSV